MPGSPVLPRHRGGMRTPRRPIPGTSSPFLLARGCDTAAALQIVTDCGKGPRVFPQLRTSPNEGNNRATRSWRGGQRGAPHNARRARDSESVINWPCKAERLVVSGAEKDRRREREKASREAHRGASRGDFHITLLELSIAEVRREGQ